LKWIFTKRVSHVTRNVKLEAILIALTICINIFGTGSRTSQDDRNKATRRQEGKEAQSE